MSPARPVFRLKLPAITTPGLPDRDHFRQFFLVEVNSQLSNTGLQIGELQSQINESRRGYRHRSAYIRRFV